MKINISNFQKLKEQSLDIPKGFNCIVGPSNLGKSTLLRSIFSVFRNDFHPSYISKNEQTCKISVTFDDKEMMENISSISLVKSKTERKSRNTDGVFEVTAESSSRTNTDKLSENTYIICQNDKELSFPKSGKDIPQIMSVYDFSPVITEREDSFDLNYQSQFNGMFLFTDSEPAVSSLFNVLFDTTRYEKALKLMLSDISKYTKEYNQIKDEIPQTRVVLDNICKDLNNCNTFYDTLISMYDNHKSSENIYKTVLSDMESLKSTDVMNESIQTDRASAGQNDNIINKLKGITESFEQYKTVKVLISLVNSILISERELSDSHKISEYVDSLISFMERLNAVRTVRTLEKSVYNDSVYSDMLDSLTDSITDIVDRCECLKTVRTCYNSLSDFTNNMKKDSQVLSDINSIALMNEQRIILMSDIQDIRNSIKYIYSTESDISECKKQNELAISYMTDMKDSIDNVIKISGHCPLCGHKHTKRKVKDDGNKEISGKGK